MNRTAIKAQALADFIQETTRIVEEKEWETYVDGSATKHGAGAGIILTERAGVKRVKVHSNSQLTQQLSGQCEVKEERMRAYVEKVKELENQFQGMNIEHIARTKNQRADFLAKIGSSLIDSRE